LSNKAPAREGRLSIEGEALEGVEVLGVATHAINDLRQDASPV